MKLSLEIRMDNQAFADDWTWEAIDCLKRVIKGIEEGRDGNVISDVNGNSVGNWTVEGD